MLASKITLNSSSEATRAPRNWAKGSIRVKCCPRLIPYTLFALELPFDVTLDPGIQGNHAGSASSLPNHVWVASGFTQKVSVSCYWHPWHLPMHCILLASTQRPGPITWLCLSKGVCGLLTVCTMSGDTVIASFGLRILWKSLDVVQRMYIPPLPITHPGYFSWVLGTFENKCKSSIFKNKKKMALWAECQI